MRNWWTGALACLVVAFGSLSCNDIAQCQGNQKCIAAVIDGWFRDNTGYNPQSAGLGGSGTVSAVTKVQLMQPGSDGSLSLVAEGMVTADGHFTISGMASEKFIVQ